MSEPPNPPPPPEYVGPSSSFDSNAIDPDESDSAERVGSNLLIYHIRPTIVLQAA